MMIFFGVPVPLVKLNRPESTVEESLPLAESFLSDVRHKLRHGKPRRASHNHVRSRDQQG